MLGSTGNTVAQSRSIPWSCSFVSVPTPLLSRHSEVPLLQNSGPLRDLIGWAVSVSSHEYTLIPALCRVLGPISPVRRCAGRRLDLGAESTRCVWTGMIMYHVMMWGWLDVRPHSDSYCRANVRSEARADVLCLRCWSQLADDNDFDQ